MLQWEMMILTWSVSKIELRRLFGNLNLHLTFGQVFRDVTNPIFAGGAKGTGLVE